MPKIKVDDWLNWNIRVPLPMMGICFQETVVNPIMIYQNLSHFKIEITLLLAPLSFKMEVTNASRNYLFQAICEAKQIVPDGRYSFQCRTQVRSPGVTRTRKSPEGKGKIL